MNKLTKQDYKNIEKVVSYDRIFKDEKYTKKMMELLQKRYDKDVSVINKECPNLNDDEISEILEDYRNYKELVQATEIFTDFSTNYSESNVSKFITKDDIEELKTAIEEMESFVGNMEVK
ncbi:pathogenicity island protein [Staphylococcus saprophyticus]|uniref:pathogenicity island protein n=1 Tax=Staphylococcus saprophyticus TaxID=29385 RepID=UPI001013C60B|nr:pathogenicity island protein [Staphylococcus saprophyticus]MBN6092368.1 pathogenicity island protein [Staphylococcus saprophyticus]MDW4312498.1 pathogenicity island protein [Staphylococcus saprophyticus]MDW4371587.1 pathogenicity island protein [Staphylococcus saprophyticus]RXS01979.1 pathogenicity island protein [Staphylococcus saprophyticus]